MIYDRLLTVAAVPPGVRPTAETLTTIRTHYFASKTISAKRFYESIQAGQRLDCLLEIPGWWGYSGLEYVCVGSNIYTLEQAEERTDTDGLPVTWFSLRLCRRTWADTLVLIGEVFLKDAEGYPQGVPERRNVVCSIVSGTDGKDTDSGDKSRLRRSAVVEIYSTDYQGERLAEFRGVSYEVAELRETDNYTLRLTLREAIR